MPGLIKVTNIQTGKLKHFEEGGRIIAEVNGKTLIVTKLGLKHGYSVKGETLIRDGSLAW